MKEKIIEIIGFGIERELAELRADEIIKLFDTNIKKKRCMSCEKEVDYSEGIFTCYECSK